MSLRTSLAIVVLFLVGAIGLQSMAQQPEQAGGTVHGVVVDPDSALIPGATVTLTSAAKKSQVAQSKSDGTYTFRGVAPGTYSLTVTSEGFNTFVKLGVKIDAATNLTLDAKLAILDLTQQTTVTTDATTVGVDPENNASSTTISGAALDALSDDPDELQSELTALAGPAAGPNGGQIYIDGFTGGTLPPKSSIREIRINQNPFSAQYDQLGYGRIEVFTKPGTDKYHGSTNVQFNNKALNTSTPFLGPANNQPDYHTIFAMGNLTGPVREGMSFTVSGSYRDIANNNIINPTAIFSASPSSTTVCAPGTLSCSSNPYPENARAVPAPQTRWDISPRLDIALGGKNTLTARYQYNTTSATNNGSGISLPATGAVTSNSEQSIQISDTQLVSNRVINETRFEYERTKSNSSPLSTGPSLNVQGIFTAGGSGGGSINATTGDHVEIQNYTSIALAKNFLRLGGRLRTSGESISSNGGSNGTFVYSYLLDPCSDPTIATENKPAACGGKASTTPCLIAAVSSYQCGVASQFNVTAINKLTVGARETDVGFYAEDDWKARPNLTVSYGVRLEAQNSISSSHDIAPRISIAYGIPRSSGTTTTVIRAGFGIFYNRFTLANIMNTEQNNGTNQINSVFAFPGTTCQPTTTGPGTGCPTAAGPTGLVSIYSQGAGLRSAAIMQSAVTVEQQVGRHASVSVTYLNARGTHQFLTRAFPSAATKQLDFQYQSGGVFRQNQINTNINVRAPRGVTLFGFYAASWANSNVSNITNPYDPRVDYGRAAFAVQNRLAIGGNIPLPFRISASPLIFANSGSPYNITTGLDENLDSVYNDRPAFLPGATSANCHDASTFYTPATGSTYTPIPVNYCTGPATASVNLRLARTFGIGPKTEAALAAAARQQQGGPGGPGGPGGFGGGPGGPGGGGGGRGGPGGGGPGGPGGFGGGGSSGRKYNLTLGVQASNLFNQVPYGIPVGTLSNAKFGETTSLQGGFLSSGNAVRRIMLQANFSF